MVSGLYPRYNCCVSRFSILYFPRRSLITVKGEMIMNMPKPGEQHLKLRRLMGEWVGEEHLHPSPWDQKGGVATGRIHNRLALEGFAVIQDYEQERNGGVTFLGHGIFTWDPGEKCYILYWFDSLGLSPNLFKGTFDKEILTLTSKSEQGQTRAVFDFGKDSTYRYSMEVSPDGSQWVTFMDGHYARSGL
jgi:hypothetical protein